MLGLSPSRVEPVEALSGLSSTIDLRCDLPILRLERLAGLATLTATAIDAAERPRGAFPEKTQTALTDDRTAVPVESVEAATKAADVVFLATPFPANESVLPPLADALAGKVLEDCTNPVGSGLTHGLRNERSGSELVQSLVPQARVVKAFAIYGYENFNDTPHPAFGVKPAILFCGDDDHAKQVVAGLNTGFGFEPVDVGGLVQALHLEHITLLWVRRVRVGGHSPHLVWAALRH